jgi:2,4-dienoyl-CoA reductase-like NADH-dependent reductase (Old Yellow Enzyme family)
MPSTLFSPFPLRGVTLENRIVVAPMCQYMSKDGVPGDWHLVHLGQFAQASPGLILMEATGVTPEGRITPGCLGLYSDESEAALSRIAAFSRSVGTSKIGIQLNHAGRKASTAAPWDGGGELMTAEAWQAAAPSSLPYLPTWRVPHAMTIEDIDAVKRAFADAARRAARIDLDVIEVHAAHGYLLHQFMSPLSNQRTDRYGGSLENRIRLTLEVFQAVRDAFPAAKPVIVRISATDWVEGAWDLASSIVLARALKTMGCDLIHVSSGGLDQRQKIVPGPGYQVGFSEAIRRDAGIATMAVGQITEPIQAETILRSGQADLVALARSVLWNPRWSWHAALALGDEVALPVPYARCHPAMRSKPFVTRS